MWISFKNDVETTISPHHQLLLRSGQYRTQINKSIDSDRKKKLLIEKNNIN